MSDETFHEEHEESEDRSYASMDDRYEASAVGDDVAAESDGDSDAAAPVSAAMGSEFRFGLSIIGLLVVILGAVVYIKVGSPGMSWLKKEVAQETSPAPEGAAALSNQSPPSTTLPTEPPVQPVQLPTAADDSAAVDPFTTQTENRAGNRYQPEAHPAVALTPQPVASNEGAGSPPPADGADIEPGYLPSDVQAGHIERVSANEEVPGSTSAEPPQTFAPVEVPAEPPRDGGPVMAVPETAIPLEASAAAPASDNDVTPAAGHEPNREVPLDAPYGKRPIDDRYGDHRSPPVEAHAPQPAHAAPVSEGNGTWNEAGPIYSGDHPSAHHSTTPQFFAPAPHGGAHPQDHGAAPHAGTAPHAGHVMPHDSYVVQPNDSYWSIAQKAYGVPGYFKALQRYNRQPGTRADALSVGDKVLVPPVEMLEQKYPELCPKRRNIPKGAGAQPTSHHGAPPGRTYVVEQGDTLFDIARYELGKASRWSEIYELNRDRLGDDYDYIAPGTTLILPDVGNRSDTVTSRPAGVTR